MQNNLRIGRLFGIDVHVDWSWVFIFLLVTWNLGALFGQMHPGWSFTWRWGVALVAALLFFASVLAHELAHALMAEAQGVPVRNIILFLFGGVANIQRDPPSPKAEFLITIVGPLTSVILGLIITVLGRVIAGPLTGSITNPTSLVAQLDPLATLLLWLGPINIVLGVFNLVPGFPLDGGRILRSILWAATDNLRQATRWASWVGQAVAWLMIVGGIAMVFGVSIPFFGSGLVGGLWLAFIGWFLNSAAIQSYQQVMVQDILAGVPVGRLMRANPPVVPPGSSVSSLVHDYVMGTDDHAFPVVDSGRLVGLVTLSDIRGISPNEWDQTAVYQIMTPVNELVTISANEDAAEVLNKLQEKDVRQLPVLHNGNLVGLLRRRDIIRWLQIQAIDRAQGRRPVLSE